MTKTYPGSSNLTVRTLLCSMLLLFAATSSCKKDQSTKVESNNINESTANGNAVSPANLSLGTAANYTILSKTGISTTGKTAIQGNMGVSPIAATAITGFGLILDGTNQFSTSALVSGKVYAADYAAPTPAALTVAISDMEKAYTVANGLVFPTPVTELNNGDLSGLTLAPGIYKWSTGVSVSKAGLILKGGKDDKWVFQIAQDFNLSSNTRIKLTGGAMAKNITWVVAGQAVLGTNSKLCGTILSKTLISLNTGAHVTGKLFAQTAVTLDAATVNIPN